MKCDEQRSPEVLHRIDNVKYSVATGMEADAFDMRVRNSAKSGAMRNNTVRMIKVGLPAETAGNR